MPSAGALPPPLRAIAATRFAASLGTVALSYLTWDRRARAMETVAARQGWHYPDRKAKPGAEVISIFAEPDPLRAEFAAAFRAEHPEWTKEDAEAAVALMLQHCRRLTDWMDLLIGVFGVALEFEAGEPRVALARSAGWEALADHFDPDALVCYLLAVSGRGGQLGALDGWGITTRIGDGDLGAVIKDGITDLHVHLGGVRSGQMLWRNVLNRVVRLERVPRYAPSLLEKLQADPAQYDGRVWERDRIVELIGQLDDRRTALGRYWSAPRAGPDETLAEANEHILLRERSLLIQAWQALIDEDGPRGDRCEIEFQLDRYLHAKNGFLRHHRQARRTSPGLGAFREYFRAAEPIWPAAREAPPRFQMSQSVLMRPLAEYAAYISQSSALRRVEFRVSPFESPRDYEQFFRAWGAVEKEFGLDRQDIDIRFAIHFIRSAKSGGSGDTGTGQANFLKLLDQRSATLHRYRTEAGWQQAHRIARIDFAGQERDMPPDAAAFCMKLTRGDREAVAALSSGDCDEAFHRYWLWHRRRGTAAPAVGQGLLGLTCHAGEDYGHPVEGIYCVASALSLLNMRPGDTIGHGLALGQDIAAYDRARSARVLTVRGLQFDALLWLHVETQREGCGTPADTLLKLDAWLRQEASEIYGTATAQLTSPSFLAGLFAERAGPVVRSADEQGLCTQLRLLEIGDKDCAGARGHRVPIAEIVYELRPTIIRLQDRVLKRLSESGIVLEFNPSSNLRVSGSATAEEVPFMAILKVMRAQVLATINTDNPGTFGTCIENEYAMVMTALGEAGFSRAERLDVVRRLRDVGRTLVYWPTRREPRPRLVGRGSDSSDDMSSSARPGQREGQVR